MVVALVWVIAFAVILFLTLKSWDGALGRFFANRVPKHMRSTGDERWVWCPAIAVLGATAIISPVDMLLTLILLAIILWVVKKLVGISVDRVK